MNATHKIILPGQTADCLAGVIVAKRYRSIDSLANVQSCVHAYVDGKASVVVEQQSLIGPRHFPFIASSASELQPTTQPLGRTTNGIHQTGTSLMLVASASGSFCCEAFHCVMMVGRPNRAEK